MSEQVTKQVELANGDKVNITVNVTTDKGDQSNEPVVAHAGRKRPSATFTLEKDVIEAIEREAYWRRKHRSHIVNDILKKYYQDKSFSPIPTEPDLDD